MRWSLKYRPRKFSDIVGQPHVVKFFKVVLSNWFKQKQTLPVGVLFSGGSGVGKTTMARVVAASLNCDSRMGVEPCGQCETCKQIISGSGGILEIDSSFFGLVDNVRELRAHLRSYSFMNYEVVIFDECHLMSREAFGVLLKLLEEPPQNVFFILITTETEAVLDTVKSRLLEFRFRALHLKDAVDFLMGILKKENVKCSRDVCVRLYKMSGENLREAIMLLEQLSIVGEGEISLELVGEVCGDLFIYQKIFQALSKGDFDKAFSLYQGFSKVQPDLVIFVNGFLDFLGSELRKALRERRNSDIYAVVMKTVYRFVNIPFELKGSSAVKMLFLDIIENLGVEKRSERQEKIIGADELEVLLTGKKG